MEQDERWLSTREYLDMREYFEWQKKVKEDFKDKVVVSMK
jgi:hypothetical protein